MSGIRVNLVRGDMRAAFVIGFCILFAFIGAFTYVNFVLVRARRSLTPMSLGLVYLVFAPSLATTAAEPSLSASARGWPLRGGGSPLRDCLLRLLQRCRPFWPDLRSSASGHSSLRQSHRATSAETQRRIAGLQSGLYPPRIFLEVSSVMAVLGIVFEQWGWFALPVFCCARDRGIRIPDLRKSS